MRNFLFDNVTWSSFNFLKNPPYIQPHNTHDDELYTVEKQHKDDQGRPTAGNRPVNEEIDDNGQHVNERKGSKNHPDEDTRLQWFGTEWQDAGRCQL